MHRDENAVKKVFFTPFSFTNTLDMHVNATARVDAFARTISAIHWRRALTN